MRFILDGHFPNESIDLQLNRIVGLCLVLRTKFMGSTRFQQPKPSSIAIDLGKSLFASACVPKQVCTKKMSQDVKLYDCLGVIDAWKRIYGDQLFIDMKLRIEYWENMTGIRNESNYTRKIAVHVGGLLPDSQRMPPSIGPGV
jgi:hypothetical protein